MCPIVELNWLDGIVREGSENAPVLCPLFGSDPCYRSNTVKIEVALQKPFCRLVNISPASGSVCFGNEV